MSLLELIFHRPSQHQPHSPPRQTQPLEAACGALLRQSTALLIDSGISMAVTFAVGLSTGCALCNRATLGLQLRSWRFSWRRHERAGYCCAVDTVLKRRGYSVGYSYTDRCPMWVSMILCPVSVVASQKRVSDEASFSLDPDVPACSQTAPAAYNASGWDRGHLAARATIAFCPRAAAETYWMTNVVPQDPTLNRVAWRRLERLVRLWAAEHGRLAVVTGPVFGDRSRAAKRSNNATAMRVGDTRVPDSLFLAVISLSNPSHSIAFHVPNAAPPADKQEIDAWLQEHALPIRDLEQRTGRRIFRHLPFWSRPWYWQRRAVSSKFTFSRG
jgi:DNA/RNA endonuclease G (NUC1)